MHIGRGIIKLLFFSIAKSLSKFIIWLQDIIFVSAVLTDKRINLSYFELIIPAQYLNICLIEKFLSFARKVGNFCRTHFFKTGA